MVVVGTSAPFEAREWTGHRRSHSWFGFHSPPISPTSSHLLSWLPLFCDLGCAATGVLVVLSFFETKQQQLNISSFVAIGSYTSLNLPDWPEGCHKIQLCGFCPFWQTKIACNTTGKYAKDDQYTDDNAFRSERKGAELILKEQPWKYVDYWSRLIDTVK